jgi:hypothetical protein
LEEYQLFWTSIVPLNQLRSMQRACEILPTLNPTKCRVRDGHCDSKTENVTLCCLVTSLQGVKEDESYGGGMINTENAKFEEQLINETHMYTSVNLISQLKRITDEVQLNIWSQNTWGSRAMQNLHNWELDVTWFSRHIIMASQWEDEAPGAFNRCWKDTNYKK